jgi:NAD dependent epimerase/dehydratase family enzyme
VTGFALRLVFGKEMAEELFLGGQKVMPERLLKGGFIFAFPRLKEALKYELEPEKGQ